MVKQEKCILCGKDFDRSNNRQKYCSISCQQSIANKKRYEIHIKPKLWQDIKENREIKNCLVCNMLIQGMRRDSKYCCEKCRRKAESSRLKETITQWKINNKNKISENQRNRLVNNRDKKKISDKKYYEKNKDKILLKVNNYYLNNKNTILEKVSNYYNNIKNTNEFKEKRNKYQNYLSETNLNYKLTTILRRRILHALNGENKSKCTLDLLGCDLETFVNHLSKTYFETYGKVFNWDKYNGTDFHIDHIKPCASFDLTLIEEQKKCFHYSNMQLLIKKDNLIKGKKYGLSE